MKYSVALVPPKYIFQVSRRDNLPSYACSRSAVRVGRVETVKCFLAGKFRVLLRSVRFRLSSWKRSQVRVKHPFFARVEKYDAYERILTVYGKMLRLF